MSDFNLGIPGFRFSDLYNPLRLRDLHTAFWQHAEKEKPGVTAKFDKIGKEPLTPPQESEILIEAASVLGGFVVKLFKIEAEASALANLTEVVQPAFRLKKDFLNLRVFKRFTEAPVSDADFLKLDAEVQKIVAFSPKKDDPEVRFAEVVLGLVEVEKPLTAGTATPEQDARVQTYLGHLPGTPLEKLKAGLKLFEDWSVQVYVDGKRRARIQNWSSYVRPNKLDFENLVPLKRPTKDMPEEVVGAEHMRHRDGFKLTDPRMTRKEYLREVDYCIYCHNRQKDSCSSGFQDKATGGYQKNPLGIPLTGCPLDERISEMHLLRKNGEAVASLAMVILDNPMCPGTGHRICNDCMKGCIFQKQDPVNIPQTETGTLTDVLSLPYGFEIYSLLTRFNPINKKRPYALPYNGNDTMVVGLGPAGYTMVHYLANEGFGVVGIDGLKLEPLSDELTGRGRPFPEPVKDFNILKESLDERILMGFGGVSEYGITVRWDKTFLSVIYLTLLRRNNVRFYGGVRFGGTLTLDDVWSMGFKHVALATGAGRPTIIDMKNNLIRGIRKASDFLMALQLTGAFKRASMANLQVRLPAIIIGGGLTAVDTATELLAYYPVQVEKAVDKYDSLVTEFGEDKVWQMCDPEEKEILTTFIAHGKEVRAERAKAKAENRNPNFIDMCRKWGGVSLAYRKKLTDSPAYRLNHEEVAKALEEGISFIENMTPVEAKKDQYGSVEALVFKGGDGREITLPAKSVCVAAGTSPNTIYEREFPGTFQLDSKGNFFKKFAATPNGSGFELKEASGGEKGFFLSYQKDGKFVSYYGDNHPDYAGNVVKAMASAKHGAPEVFKLFAADIKKAETSSETPAKFEKLVAELDETLVPRVVAVNRLTSTIIEVVVKGRYAARKFEPGQFYRLQNYEALAPVVDGVRLTLEGIALTGAWVEKEKDLLSMIVLEMGVSSRLCGTLKVGQPVIVMGPTGTPSETPAGETVLLAGGGLGNAVLFSIGQAFKRNGSKVVYFAGYRKKEDVFMQERVEEGTDQIIWAVDSGDPIVPRRPQDLAFVGNIVQAMVAYAEGKLQKTPLVPLKSVDRILAIGSDRMMAAVQQARHGILKPFLKEGHIAIASINSPMQCMMKEVCAQCLQKHVDPVTGKETKPVFSCFNQDQEMDCVDFTNLRERLKVNSLSEKLSSRYLDVLLQRGKIAHV